MDKRGPRKGTRVYDTAAWKKLRVVALQRDNYLCRDCLLEGRITLATEVHHEETVESRPDMSLDIGNLRSLCRDCHEATKERKGAAKTPDGVRIIRITGGGGGTPP